MERIIRARGAALGDDGIDVGKVRTSVEYRDCMLRSSMWRGWMFRKLVFGRPRAIVLLSIRSQEMSSQPDKARSKSGGSKGSNLSLGGATALFSEVVKGRGLPAGGTLRCLAAALGGYRHSRSLALHLEQPAETISQRDLDLTHAMQDFVLGRFESGRLDRQ